MLAENKGSRIIRRKVGGNTMCCCDRPIGGDEGCRATTKLTVVAECSNPRLVAGGKETNKS